MEVFGSSSNFTTGNLRENVVYNPKNDHTEKAINALIKVKFIDNGKLGKFGYSREGENYSDIT